MGAKSVQLVKKNRPKSFCKCSFNGRMSDFDSKRRSNKSQSAATMALEITGEGLTEAKSSSLRCSLIICSKSAVSSTSFSCELHTRAYFCEIFVPVLRDLFVFVCEFPVES